jgi:hypothetical protein
VFYYERMLDIGPLEQIKIGERRVFFGERWEDPTLDPTMLMLRCTGAPRPTQDVVKQLGRARTP